MKSNQTSATFNVISAQDSIVTDIQVVSDEGYPEGFDLIGILEFIPTIVSIEPSSGSSAGSMVKVSGTGFGPSTKGL